MFKQTRGKYYRSGVFYVVRANRSYAADSVPMNWLISDHVGAPTNAQAAIEDLRFLRVVRAEMI
jgi:hypothetical protein